MKRLIFKAPVTTASGYGVHSRQILKALLDSGEYEIDVICLPWGQTPFIKLGEDPIVDKAYELELREQRGAYDVSVQVTIPNEFEKMAAVNIGVTAGIEVDRVSPSWIVRANETVDLVIVPSQHSAQTFAGVQYQKENGEVLRLTRPIVVVPEGFDSNDFFAGKETDSPFSFDTPFNFISVGLGMEKGPGEDRKNISTLIKWFCETFKGSKEVGLVLKVGVMGNSLIDFEYTKNKIKAIKDQTGCGQFPKIHLVHGRYSQKEMASLYRNPTVKAYVSLTHGEGFGLPILEAAACGLPIIATNWSGHLDFLSINGKKKFVDLAYDMTEIPPSVVWNGVIEQGTRWASVKEEDTKTKLRKVHMSYEKPAQWADELRVFLAQNFSVSKTNNRFAQVLKEFLSQVAAASSQQRDPQQIAASVRKQLGVKDGEKTILYTMPMSGGDVFISTAVVDSIKAKFPNHKLFFATQGKYADILKENKHIERVVNYEPWMADVPFCEKIFDEVYTPNLAIQTVHANWIRGGKGRRLADEMAAQCQVELGDYFIKTEEVTGLPEKFIALHPGSGKGQHEARNYLHWQEVVHNLKKLSSLPVVQVGSDDEPLYEGTIDLRGKTSYNQLAYVIQKSSCLVGIDSISMHLAAALGTNHVAIFGSSYANSTGPVLKTKVASVLLETKNRYGCEKACYKYECVKDKDHPCLNEISGYEVIRAALSVLGLHDYLIDKPDLLKNYEEITPKIAGYTHVLNAESQGFPYIESIKSMLGFCDQVVVVDGGSTDGTVEKVKAINDPRIKLLNRNWDWSEPGMDGIQKAFARAMCDVGPNDFLWQQDADEVVHERDYDKIKKLVKRFPRDVDLMHLPVVELWGSAEKVRTDRHSWKWRLSRNNFRITHGINKDARVFDTKTGRTYAKKGMSDGCEYIDIMTGEFIPHRGFYDQRLDLLRRNNPQAYGERMNEIFEQLPSVYHYSWASLPRKVRNFRDFWDKCWSNLYNDPQPVPRFPDVKSEGDVRRKAEELKEQGGEHGRSQTFTLKHSNPAVMGEWIVKEIIFDDGSSNAHRHLHHDDQSTGASPTVP